MLLILCFTLLVLFLLLGSPSLLIILPPQDTPAAPELFAAHDCGRPLSVDLLVEHPELVYLPTAECAGDVMPPVFIYPAAGSAVDVMPPESVYPAAAAIGVASVVDVMSSELVYFLTAVIAAGSAVDVMPPMLVYAASGAGKGGAGWGANEYDHACNGHSSEGQGQGQGVQQHLPCAVHTPSEVQQVEEYNQREVLMLEQEQADQKEVLRLEQE
ncbi:hypothetical protein BDR04DRAFT_1206065 [Suillus decipiens]|nr:hypothetical protein BDR04DRAFT_1206065 [Suillus decipiens]